MISFSTPRQALRGLWRSPVFTFTVVLSLAFGIGGNAAIFSIVNALFLHPAGVVKPEQVVAPRVTYKKLHLDRIDLSTPDYLDVRNSRQIFASAALASEIGVNYTAGDSPQRIDGAAVSADWFNVFGAKPMLGRAFLPQDDQPGANHVAVLSYDLWKRIFGGQSSAIGQVMELDRKAVRVIGVMPANFRWPSQAEIWMPLGLSNQAFAPTHRLDEFYPTVARLQPGVTYAQAQQYMKVLTERAKMSNKEVAAYANDAQWSMELEPFTELTAGDLKTPLFVLSTAIGLVLLIACSNIAGLMLVRGSGRSRELAVRRALGATTRNLLGQALTEVALLAAAGTALGLLSVSLILKALLLIAPARLTAGLVIEPDTHVLLFTIAAGVLASCLFGLVPAWQAAQLGETYLSLKEGGRAETAGVERQRMRSALVIGQIALALILLLGTGMLLGSLSRLRSTHLGFDPAHLMTAAVSLPDSSYKEDAKQIAFFHAVVDQLKSSPGVVSAAAAQPVPFNGAHWTGSFEIQGRPSLPGDPGPHGYRGFVSPDYFPAMRIPLQEGRFFSDSDRLGSEPVAIVDVNLARTYWPGKDPVGQKIRNGSSEQWATVVGVVNHVRAYNFSPTDTRGIYYKPIYQEPSAYMNFVVRTAGDARPMASLIARAVHRLDPSQAVFDIATPAERISKALGAQQFAVELLTTFACAAMLLAALGLYGVVSFNAGQRTKEIGIRSALGASRGQILMMIAGQGLRLIAAGVATGGLLAIFLAPVVGTQMENVSLDSATFAVVVMILTAIAFVAAAIPAWRSATMDAVAALRSE